MTKKQSVFMIDWRGPYEGKKLRENRNTSVLYLAVGSTDKQLQRKFQYCGITGSDLRSRSRQHRKLSLIRHCKIWEGWFTFPNPYLPPRKDLELAEWIIVYYWNDLLNERKVASPPPSSGIVISRWCNRNRKRSTRPTPFKQLPDVIAWDSKTKWWRTGDLLNDYADDDWKSLGSTHRRKP